ncbi:DUF2147 domain-containing protein [Capnocytophaga canimorsus]|uniref:DUF2147 domain-containing protein n=1 Tax=Capnocytophaga canimorsus TaxID=28188 RepID=UPI00384BBBB4
MKKIHLLTFLLAAFTFTTQAQSVLGKWKTIDDETGKEKSIVQIYEEKGIVYGKIVSLLEKDKKSLKCTACTGNDKDKPLEGLVIIKDLQKDGNQWNGGKILDPKTGKQYKCYITLEDANKLKVRGYIGVALMGRTQYWHRVE